MVTQTRYYVYIRRALHTGAAAQGGQGGGHLLNFFDGGTSPPPKTAGSKTSIRAGRWRILKRRSAGLALDAA